MSRVRRNSHTLTHVHTRVHAYTHVRTTIQDVQGSVNNEEFYENEFFLIVYENWAVFGKGLKMGMRMHEICIAGSCLSSPPLTLSPTPSQRVALRG